MKTLNKRFGLALLSGLIALMSFSPSAFALREMEGADDIGRLFSEYESRIDQLPQSGTVRQTLWSDTYWASNQGGAASRWQMLGTGAQTDPHSYGVYSAIQLGQLSDAQINQLSPAEKYDIVMGRYDYPTVASEMRRTNPSLPKWHGLCHAVAAVTTRYEEPQNTPVTTTFPDGSRRNVMFYSSDIKALLALAGDKSIANATGVGVKCNSNMPSSSGACWDTNPASFYLALTNMVGLLKTPIIMDVDPLLEVWNSVVKSYSAQITNRSGINQYAARGTVREVRVDLSVTHTIGAKPARMAVGGKFKSSVYAFTLELDNDDQIIGGEWISANRPDMIWFTNPDLRLDPRLSFLQQLTTPVQ